MKKTTSIFVVSVFSMLALSGVSYSQTDEQMDSCKGHAALANKIMTQRQLGTPLSHMMEVANETDKAMAESTGKPLINGVRLLVIDAYKESRYRTEKHQQLAINDFADNIYMSCITHALESTK